jgi:hypothetical protein
MQSNSPLNPGHPFEDDVVSRDEPSSSAWVDRPIPPLIQQGQEAYRRDLPELLKKHKGKWVAYSGDRQLGIGRSKPELFQWCVRQGLGRDEFVVRGITPELPDELDLEEILEF